MSLSIVGETWQEFIKKNNIQGDGTNSCIICKREFSEPSDWGYFKDVAFINWKHPDCRNTGPSRATIIGKSGKELAGIF